MLYVLITVLFVAIVLVSVKLAKTARQLRFLSTELELVRAGSISHDSALYAGDRRFADGVAQGYAGGYSAALIAAEKAATDAVVAGKPPVLAIRALRNATK